MANIWLTYVPYHVAQDILAHPTENPLARESRFEAVTLFADVSGFTAMSEALGRTGKGGTEELTQILNNYFDPTINLIQSYGGIVGKFGGDALTVLFPYVADDQADVIRRAVQCALEMQQSMSRYQIIPTSAGIYGLMMKVGLGMGSVYVRNVGDPDIRLEFVIAGKPIDACSDAEHLAERGEVVVDDALLPFLPDASAIAKADGFSQIIALTTPAVAAPIFTPDEIIPATIPVFERFLHPSIAARLKIGRSDFVDEHRKITLLFVRFDGYDYDTDPEIGEKLQAYSLDVIRTIYRYDGYLNKIDMGDKGSKYIVLFGAPIAHENDEERALRCALELSRLPHVQVRIGVNTGAVFAGHVGAEVRREYTVMGDVVNLAARLMQAAEPGQVLVSGQTYDAASTRFMWQPLDPITVKGKTDPVSIYGLDGVKAPGTITLRVPQFLLPMVGRGEVLAQINAKLDLARQGNGQIVGIVADAGMGKSRLSAEIIKLAFEHDLVGYKGDSESYNTNLGYVVWHNIWRGFFRLDPADPAPVQLYRLQTQLEALNPAYLQRMPLLSSVLNLAIPENDFTENLTAELRQELLFAFLLELLRQNPQPILLILEDCHWLDPLSKALLEFLARNVGSLSMLIVVLYRPLGEALLPDQPNFTEITLPEFAPEEVRELITLKLEQLYQDVGHVPAAFVDRITRLAQGNPFYIAELMNLLRDRDIDFRDANALQTVALPDSLHTLILSRIDELSEDEKTVLKVASVIGRIFRASWLPGTYPELGASQRILQQLSRLEALELTPLDRPEPELEYLFKHILTQEVAYESISFLLRQNLHERVGRFIENRYEHQLSDFYYLLAFHYGNTKNVDKQRTYYRLAGDAARTGFIHQAALDYYQRLLPLLEDDVTRGDVLYDLGQVWQITGRWEEAKSTYREALTLAAQDEAKIAYRQNALGDVLSYEQSNVEAAQFFETARTAFERLGDFTGLNQTLTNLCYLYIRQGDYEALQNVAEQQLQIADQTGNEIIRADATLNLGTAALFTDDNDSAIARFRESAQVAEGANYKQGVIYALSNMVGVFVNQADYLAALESLNQALDSANEIGYTRAAAVITGNRGHVYEQVGLYEEAIFCYEQSLRQGLELGDFPNVQLNIGNIAGVRFKQGLYNEAEQFYARAIALDHTLNLPFFLCGYLLEQARTLMALGRYDEAQPLIAQALRVAQANEEGEVEFGAQLSGAILPLRLGQSTLTETINLLQNLRAGVEDQPSRLAQVVYEMWALDQTNAALQVESAALYRSLYNETPTAPLRQRLLTLNGTDPADIPALAELPALLINRREAWANLLPLIDTHLG